MLKVYIDGQHGTSGLRLSSLVEEHPLLTFLHMPESERRNKEWRQQCFAEADLVILCLPDSQVEETLKLIPANKRVLDCGVTFRSHAEWAYGLPELGRHQRSIITKAKYVANPGCFALAFILIVKPLIEAGYLKTNETLSAFALNAYSAGGQRMIKHYESGRLKGQFHGLNQSHKHIKEMMTFSGLNQKPVFIPSVGTHKEGLILTVPVAGVNRSTLLDFYTERYLNESLITLCTDTSDSLSPIYLNNGIEIYVNGTADSIVTARMSNLLKGAAGTALQNINLMLGLDECLGLC